MELAQWQGIYLVLQKGSGQNVLELTTYFCIANSVELAACDAAKSFSIFQSALDLAQQVVVFIRASSKWRDIFDSLQNGNEDIDESAQTSLRPLCPTHWKVKADSLERIILNYSALLETLNISGYSPLNSCWLMENLQFRKYLY